MKSKSLALLSLATLDSAPSVSAWVCGASHHYHPAIQQPLHRRQRSAAASISPRSPAPLVLTAASTSTTEVEEPKRNPDRPELPELKGDFDWDEKFGADDDWITGERVPGKMVLNELELAAQISALERLESQWRKERQEREFEEGKNVGFVEKAELINGRTAMFFLVTGLLTEYWTGFSLPAQVEEMLRIGGFLGFE